MRKSVYGVFWIVFVIVLQLSCMVIFASARTDFLPAWPLRHGSNIISLDFYQEKERGRHSGIDIGHGKKPKQDVYAVADGTVVSVENLCDHFSVYPHSKEKCKATSFGNFVKIRHNVNDKVFYSQYSHLTKDSITVKEGQKVTAGTKVGKMGSSGNSEGPHLHLAIYQGEYTKDKAQKTFDFYMDNAELMKGIRVQKDLVSTSENYGTWIKENGTLSGNYYVFTNRKTVDNGPSTLAIHLTNYPTSITKGSPFGLRGEITSNYNLTTVKGYIINTDNNATLQTTSDSPNKKSMDIRLANLNQSLLFDQLPAGSYFLRIEATDASRKTLVASRSFTVEAERQNTTETNPAGENLSSTLAINLTSYPTSITKGTPFSLRGEITSNYNLTAVKGYLINSDNNSILQTTWDSPNRKSMDIRPANLNQSLLFDQLPVGSYFLRIEATDASGKTLVSSKSFTVKAENSSSSTSNQVIADGTYVIATKLDPNYVLDISDASTKDGANLQLWERNGTPAQAFQVTHAGNGYYQIVNVNSGKAIDVQNGSTAAEANVWQYQINHSDAQLWKIESAGNGSYYIIGKGSGLYLDVDNANADYGTNIKIFVRNEGYDAQKWIFYKN